MPPCPDPQAVGAAIPAASGRAAARCRRLLVPALLLAAEAAGAAGTLHLDRCVGNCTYVQGPESSCSNRTQIVTGSRMLTEFEHGDAAWELLVACVESVLDPYDIEVTASDPGCAVPHWEVAVAGTPSEFGLGPDVSGIAPWTCGVIPNAPAFAFANSHSDMLDLCQAVTHEFAHLLGADHLFLVRDPMTYLDGCLVKRFAAAGGACGEFGPRTCCTGAPTQSSDAILRAVLGQRPGGLIFPDSFEAWDGTTESGSTCHWDEVLGEAALVEAGRAVSATRTCGAVLASGAR
jgi:hypothetical protein